MKGWVAWVALGIAVGLPVTGLVVLKLGLRQMAEEDANINMKYIQIALRMYADMNSQFLPEVSGAAGLARLLDTGVLGRDDRKLLHHPTRGFSATPGSPIGEAEVGYLYLGGHCLEEPADTIILVEKTREGRTEGYVGFLDGRIERLRGERWQQARRLVPGV